MSNVISIEYWKRKKQNEQRLQDIDDMFNSPHLNRHLYTIKNTIVIWYNEKEELENIKRDNDNDENTADVRPPFRIYEEG